MGRRDGAVEAVVTGPPSGFWRGRRVLVTGHTGFKGSWLAFWLIRQGADVIGYALPPETEPSLFVALDLARSLRHFAGDLADQDRLASIVREHQPDVIFHLAAQPLVRASYADPIRTFATNAMGTAHLLEAVRRADGTRVIVVATTDKVYENDELGRSFREDDRLGGHDPYSASKAASELIVASYRASFLRERGVALATARAGNVIGGGDWSADRLIPDAVRAWSKGAAMLVRRPASTRPWQHVLEPLHGYLRLAELLSRQPEAAGAFNFGPPPADVADVRSVIELACASYGAGDVVIANEIQGPHEAMSLALDPAKAQERLGIAPRWPLRSAVERTMRWYAAFDAGAPAAALCEQDIADFERRS